MAFVSLPTAHPVCLRRSPFLDSSPVYRARVPALPRRFNWFASADPADVASKTDDAPDFIVTSSSSDDSRESILPSPAQGLSASEKRGHLLTTLAWVGVTAATTPILGLTRGWDRAVEFVTAYVVEYSLSVDNLFVFLLIFNYFKVPRDSQGRVLQWGIVGALCLRGTMIVAGQALTERFEAVTLAFAALLLYSAAQLLFGDASEDDDDLSSNGVVKFARSIVEVTSQFEGDRFFTLKNGIRMATPLFLVLVCVELSDVVFALDSVPAVLGISDDVAVIYLSNILAIQGLRSLFFVLSDTIGELRYLSQALATVLGFVGCKMIGGVAGYEVPILPSLAFIVAALGAGVGFSLVFPKAEEETT